MIISTINAIHIARRVSRKRGEKLMKYTVSQFADGEYYYRLEFAKKPKSVDLIGNITADPQSIFELLALAQAAQDNQIRIRRLIIPYLGYSRQDRLNKRGEAVLARLVTSQLNRIPCSKMIFVDLHSNAVRKMLHPHQEIEVLDHLAGSIKSDYDVIASPDRGAKERAKLVAHGLKVIVMPKQRPKANIVARDKKKYPVKNKSILIVDDMIDTGRTIATAAELLKKQGAGRIDVVAVHGVLSYPSKKILATKAINQIYVSDTLLSVKSKKIKVLSIANYLI